MTIENISGFGSRLFLVANITFPIGINLSSFPSDTNPYEFSDVEIANAEMGLSGILIAYQTPKIIEGRISLIPDSRDDINMQILLRNNRVVENKISKLDNITLTIISPNGSITIYSEGIIKSGPPGKTFDSSGKYKTHTYIFNFTKYTYTNATA